MLQAPGPLKVWSEQPAALQATRLLKVQGVQQVVLLAEGPKKVWWSQRVALQPEELQAAPMS